jgi:predicted nucleic acid-binding protein
VRGDEAANRYNPLLWPGKNRRAGVPMRIYLDVCCFCRPFDDQTSNRIRVETEAVIAILKRCTDDWALIGSEVIEFEISGISDEERRKNVRSLMQFAHEHVNLDPDLVTRARSFHEQGLETFDSLHLACAERAGAVFLTTDDALIKVIKKHADKVIIETRNPVEWFMEVTTDGSKDAQ